jgi:hypothetical protein
VQVSLPELAKLGERTAQSLAISSQQATNPVDILQYFTDNSAVTAVTEKSPQLAVRDVFDDILTRLRQHCREPRSH